MAYSVLKRSGMVRSMASYAGGGVSNSWMNRAFASVTVGTDLVSTVPNVSLQKAGGGPSISWMSRAYASVAEGTDLVSTAPKASLQRARTWDDGVSTKFSTTSLNDIFKDKKCAISGLPIKLYGGFGGSFHKSFDLGVDLSAASLVPRSRRLSTHVVDGKVKALNVEKAPSEYVVSGGGATVLRPLSPHLTIYKPQLSSTYSILHRIAYMSAVAIVYCIALLCSKAGFLFFV